MKQTAWKSVKSIEPLSLAKIISVIAGILHFLLGILMSALSYIPDLKLQLPTHPLVFITSTTAYGLIVGFIFSYIGALLYNKLSKNIGTVKVELE